MNRALVLCGLFGVGKTTWGKRVADALQWPFYDTDQLVERAFEKAFHYPLGVSEIYQQFGEKTFRDLEEEAVAFLITQPAGVVATGGGTLLRHRNRVLLKKKGLLVYLKCSMPFLCERLQSRRIPSFLDPNNLLESIHSCAHDRCSLFEALCDSTVDIEALNEEQLLHALVYYGK